MKKRLWILGATTLVLVIALATTIGAGVSVGQTGYVTDMSVSPGEVCVGELVTLSGSMTAPYSQVTVEMYWDGVVSESSEITPDQDYLLVDPYEGIVGVTQSDAGGNWSMTMPAPQIVFSPSGNTELTFTGDRWTLVATSDMGDVAYGTLVVLDCAAGTMGVAALPSTGAPVAAMSLLGSGLLGAAGLTFSSWRRRKH